MLLWARLRRHADADAGMVSPDVAPVERALSEGALSEGALFEHAPFGVLVLEGDQMRYMNVAARDMLHVAARERRLPSADWVDLLREDVSSARDEAGTGGNAYAGRYRNVAFASGRVARWWVRPEGTLDLVVLLDISAQQRARQTSRSLLSDLGHELRTPIATLLTHSRGAAILSSCP